MASTTHWMNKSKHRMMSKSKRAPTTSLPPCLSMRQRVRTIWHCSLRERKVAAYAPAVASCSRQAIRPVPSGALTASAGLVHLHTAPPFDHEPVPVPLTPACSIILSTAAICLHATSTLVPNFSFFPSFSSFICRARHNLGNQLYTMEHKSNKSPHCVTPHTPLGSSDGNDVDTHSERTSENLDCSAMVLPKVKSDASASRTDTGHAPIWPGISSACGMRKLTMAAVPSGLCMVQSLKASFTSMRMAVSPLATPWVKKQRMGRTSNTDQHLIHSLLLAIKRRHSTANSDKSGISIFTLSISDMPCTQPSDEKSSPTDRKGSLIPSSADVRRHALSTL